ncbi:MAG TPA: penicillin-binding protein 2 [Gemmatimonadales bacterium]
MTWRNLEELRGRAEIARWVVFALFGVLAIAFFRVQVLGWERFQVQSVENRLRPVTLPSPRGDIVDRNGIVIAENVPGYSVALHAMSEESLLVTLDRLHPVLPLDAAARAGVQRRYRQRPSEPVTLRSNASFDLVSALEEQRVWNPGLVVSAQPRRRYPLGRATSHVVGYVSEVSEAELQNGAIPGARPGLQVGRGGLEEQYDRRLRGNDGVQFVEVDAMGRTLRLASEETMLPPEPGENIRTTLDAPLQQYVAETFPANQRGAVVALDPRTGGVLALYSAPSYDPNPFVGGMDPTAWAAIVADPDQPLFNRAIQARYPPASPWKLAVAALALRRGLVSIDSRMSIPCTGGMQYYNRYFRCWKLDGHGDLTLREAIQYSCDVYFYQLGLKLTLPNLLHDAAELGLAAPTGIDLPSEAAPVFPPSTEYYNRRYGPRGWTNAVTLNLAIGQGENDQTLVNMVRLYAGLSNPDGVLPAPHLVEGAGTADYPTLGLSINSLQELRGALLAVVDRGTAAAARVADLHIAGKTGTAQNPHGEDHGWFVAFAPAEDPQIVVGAIVEFAEHGSAVARLVTRIIARYLLGTEAPEGDVGVQLPADSAPGPLPILPDLRLTRDSTGRDARDR